MDRPTQGTRFSGTQGFTLIELLIVIAIILILIAIALPNFLEAQLRAKVTRARGDIRAISQANEMYYLDWRVYPTQSEHDIVSNPARNRIDEKGLFWLTTPVKYLTGIPFDPFPGEGVRIAITYETGGVEDPVMAVLYGPPLIDEYGGPLVTYAIFSDGPDRDEDIKSASPHYLSDPTGADQYNPTNGARSGGDIFHYGGDPFWIGVRWPVADYAHYRNANGTLDLGLSINGQRYLHQMPPGIY